MAKIRIEQRIFDVLRTKTTAQLMEIAQDNTKNIDMRKQAYAIWKGRRLHDTSDGLYCPRCLMQFRNCLCEWLNDYNEALAGEQSTVQVNI